MYMHEMIIETIKSQKVNLKKKIGMKRTELLSQY